MKQSAFCNSSESFQLGCWASVKTITERVQKWLEFRWDAELVVRNDLQVCADVPALRQEALNNRPRAVGDGVKRRRIAYWYNVVFSRTSSKQ